MGRSDGSPPMPFEDYWQALFPSTPMPEVLYVAQGAQFAAHRNALRHTPKAAYEWLLKVGTSVSLADAAEI